MTVKVIPREAVYGRTLTNSFNGLLDERNRFTNQRDEAIKQLHKISFSNPSLSNQVNTVIRILEGRG